LSTPVPIFINRIQHFWVFTNLVRGVCNGFLEFVWPQKLKSRGVKWRIGDAVVLESVRTNLT
jgi:hypothetical protein